MADKRHALATELVELQIKISDKLTRMEEIKEELRAAATEMGEGFTEEIAGKGSVQVTAGCEKKLKGLLPVLVSEAWLAMAAAKQKKLLDAGVVKIIEQWQKATRPAVTVRL